MSDSYLTTALKEQQTMRDRARDALYARIRHIRALNPDMTEGEIARRLGCSKRTVGRALGEVNQ